jgi:hypothetical protein
LVAAAAITAVAAPIAMRLYYRERSNHHSSLRFDACDAVGMIPFTDPK